MEVEDEMHRIRPTISESSWLLHSARYDHLCEQLEHISQIKRAMKLLPNRNTDAVVPHDHEIWVAVRKVRWLAKQHLT